MTTNDTSMRKQALIQDTETFKKNMSQGMGMLNQNLKHAGLTTLLAGVAFVTTYYLARKLFGKSKKKADKPQVVSNYPNAQQLVSLRPEDSGSHWVGIIKEQLFLFVLAILKNKLSAFIENMDKDDLSKGLGSIINYFKSNTLETSNPQPIQK